MPHCLILLKLVFPKNSSSYFLDECKKKKQNNFINSNIERRQRVLFHKKKVFDHIYELNAINRYCFRNLEILFLLLLESFKNFRLNWFLSIWKKVCEIFHFKIVEFRVKEMLLNLLEMSYWYENFNGVIFDLLRGYF